MSRSSKISLLLIVVVAAALASAIYWCWQNRQTPESRREARKEVVKAMRDAKGDDVAIYLSRLASERFFHTWFDDKPPYMHVAWETKVPLDLIGQLAEEAFLRFAGNGEPNSEDVPHLKQIMAFAESFLSNNLSEDTANALRDRLLDAHFLIGDFDGAIAMLEKGMPGHDPAWAKATVAKLRAHRAMDIAAKPGQDAETVKKAKREAIDNFVAFGEYMLSPAMEKFEDCDPTTGVIYSFEWVAVKNFMRSAVLAREIGDTAKADELTARAKKYVESARKKAKEDKKSFDVFQAEMKTYGL
jgi:hypothetical protein